MRQLEIRQHWYRRLTLRLEHGAFIDGVCPAAWLEPRPDTAVLLERHRVRLRRLPAGLVLIVAMGADGQLLVPLETGAMLEFLVCADNPEFLLYTELPLPPVLLGLPRRGLTVPLLPPASGDPWTARASVRIYGDWLNMGGEEKDPPVVHLDACARYWRYYCALPNGMDPTKLGIDQDSTSPYPTRIDFDQAAQLDDPVARAFAARSAGRTIVALTSSTAIPVWTGAAPRLTLNLDGAALMDLGSPPLDSLLSAGLSQNGKSVAFRTVTVPSH